MRAKTVDQIFEFTRGGSPLTAMGLGKAGELKKKMVEDDNWTEDPRDQLMWTITNNEVALVVYLLDGQKVKPGFYWEYEINPLMKGRTSRSHQMIEPMTDDMKEILNYYQRRGNMIPSRVEYFIKKYKDHGVR